MASDPSDNEEPQQQLQSQNAKGGRKPSQQQNQVAQQQQQSGDQGNQLAQQNQALQAQIQELTRAMQQQALGSPQPNPGGQRTAVTRQSRIVDRPVKPDQKDSSLKIKIELDLEVEVDLYARVKGDVTIGLM